MIVVSYQKIPFDLILSHCMMRSLTIVHRGDGWSGKRYLFKSGYDAREHLAEDLSDLRAWIVKRYGWSILTALINNHPDHVNAFQLERKEYNG